MVAVGHATGQSRRTISPLDLVRRKEGPRTTVVYGTQGVKASNGRPLEDEVANVIEVILEDLQTFTGLVLVGDELEMPPSLTCYEIHLTYVEEDGRQDSDLGMRESRGDPVAENELARSARSDELGLILEAVARCLGLADGGGAVGARRTRVWNNLDATQRAVVRVLQRHHRTAFTATAGLALGSIDAKQYAMGVRSLRERTDEEFSKLGAAEQFDYFLQVRQDGRKAERYLSARVDELESLVGKGESESLEFKSTLRKNTRTGKKDSVIARASLKTIAGFLNTNGGTLLIGVADEGTPIPDLLARDEMSDKDTFLRHLHSKMKDALGIDVVSTVTAHFEELRGSEVCVVRCSRSATPVFLTANGGVEEFFVRNGPSTESLRIREAIRYIRQRFPEYEARRNLGSGDEGAGTVTIERPGGGA